MQINLALHSKLPKVGTTIFSLMTAEARRVGAINLAQGFPDFPCDPELVSMVHQAMKEGLNQYAPMPGLLELRQALSFQVQQYFSLSYDPDTEITITSGGTEALFAAIAALVHPGDEVIVLEPCYDSYAPAVELARGRVVSIPLTFPEYTPDWERIRDSISDVTRMIIVNTPHNPSGQLLGRYDWELLADILSDRPIWILSDEVYEFITFDNQPHISPASHPALYSRTLRVGSFGKTFHVTGWKVGYCMAPAELTTEFRKVHQFLTFATSTPFQWGIANYLTRYPERPGFLGAFYQKKRDEFKKLIADSAFVPLAVGGGYFQLCRYDAISEEADTEFVMRLTRETGVAAIPLSVFYQQPTDYKVVRFCFAKKTETLAAAGERLCQLRPKQ